MTAINPSQVYEPNYVCPVCKCDEAQAFLHRQEDIILHKVVEASMRLLEDLQGVMSNRSFHTAIAASMTNLKTVLNEFDEVPIQALGTIEGLLKIEHDLSEHGE